MEQMMQSPFLPAMDPWLEHPAHWPDLHVRLIVAISRYLAPRLRPRYLVRVEERSYMADLQVFVGRPDVLVAGGGEVGGPASPLAAREGISVLVPVQEERHERYLEIRSVAHSTVVTVLELLSPSNKLAGRGRELYIEKRNLVLSSRTHLVELDLLRTAQPMTLLGEQPRADYRILVSRSERRPKAVLYPFDLGQPIPRFFVPLAAGDEEPELDLATLLAEVYLEAGYDLALDYATDPVPRLPAERAGWAQQVLERAGLR